MNSNSTNRSFGIVFFVFFFIVSVYPILKGGELRTWSLVLSLIFLLLGIVNSRFLTPLNLVWMKFGELLGKIVSPIVLGFIFFLVITPIGLFMKLIGKDLLKTKLSKDKTYWIKRSKNITSMKRQF
tara:strand:+ start:147 stop:524 length:378 start_codon:yes stop_codon:yes gene_type:complete